MILYPKRMPKAQEEGINAVIRTHLYKFAGKTKAPEQDGAIA